MSRPDMTKRLTENAAHVSGTDKVKVMAQNMDELYQTAQDAFEDALLMGCSETQLREYLHRLITALDNPYR